MHTPTAKSELERICTVSGLPILSKPEWTHVALDSDYRANMSVIGNHIIFSQPDGYIRLQSGKKTLNLIDRVIAEAVPENQPYILIDDFSNLRGTAPDARRLFIDNMRKRDRLAGLVFLSTSTLFKISVALGKRIHKDEREIRMAGNYARAIEFSLEILSNYSSGLISSAVGTADDTNIEQRAVPAHKVVKNEAWVLNLGDFTTEMEVIDQKVLHSISSGLLQAEYVDAIVNLRKKVQKSIQPESGIEYMVADVTNLKGAGRRARKLYMDSLKQWHQTHSLRMYVLHGGNRFVQAASNLARPFMPFKIRVADDLDEALKIVSKDQITEKNHLPRTEFIDAANITRANSCGILQADRQCRHATGLNRCIPDN